MSRRSLLVLPDDSAQVILDAIAGSKHSLRVKMFVFSDPHLLKAVAAARKRGVKVRVMLNPARRDGEDDNEVSRKALQAEDVEVKDSNPDFGITHEKSMVVDDEIAYVKSLNWATKNLTETRDYAVSTSHAKEVEEIIECFEADWHRKKFEPGSSAHLIWCPANGRDRIAQFIDDAKHKLFVQNERYQDPIIIERLVRAASRGVKIHIMARPPHTLKKEKLLEGVGGMVPVDYRVQGPFAAPAAFGAGGYGFGAPGMAMLPIASPQVPAGAKVGLFVGLGGALVGVVVAVVVVLVNVGGVGLDSATEGSDVCAQAARCCELTASGPAAQNCKNLGKLGVPKAACSQSLQSFRDLATSQGKTCR